MSWMKALVVMAVAALSGPVMAETWDLEIGPLAGATSFDAGLSDYRWDTTPRFESGLETTMGQGRWRAGLRFLRSQTTQGTGLELGTADPTVRATNGALLGRVLAAQPAGIGIWVTAHAGWLHLGYTPDQVSFDSVTVNFEPVDELALGGGLALRRTLGNSWALALSGEASTFALDTAHRQGDEIVFQRDRFWNWSARLAVTWRISLGS